MNIIIPAFVLFLGIVAKAAFSNDCSMTAHPEPNESKGGQEEGWHVSDCSTASRSKSTA